MKIQNIISGILMTALLMVGTASVWAAELNQNQLEDLAGLEILQGDPNGDLRLNDTVTRAEAVKMLCMAECTQEEIQEMEFSNEFPDVDVQHWAYDYIGHAQNKGLIQGDETGLFRPDAPVTNEEIVKMAVCMAGYGAFAEENGGYPAGYTFAGSRWGFTKGLRLGVEESAIRSDVAMIVYHMLDIPLMKPVESGEDYAVEYLISEDTFRAIKLAKLKK